MKKNEIDPEKLKYIHMGREAYESGKPRIPTTTNPEQTRLWLFGYDIAKLSDRIEERKCHAKTA